MKVFKSIQEWLEFRQTIKTTIGFVPTMGALHAGHLSLVKESQENNDLTIVSIYVNPTQFNNPDDLNTYPMTLEDDLKLLKGIGVDCVLLPKYSEIYPDDYTFKISESEISQTMEGVFRSNHFDGMLTVVMKLLNIAKPSNTYFGNKDYQQLTLIKSMVAAFFIPVNIIGLSTIREKDGLAMSSRNKLLSSEARLKAAEFSRIIKSAGLDIELHKELELAGFEVDYVTTKWNRRHAAVNLNDVRLIDNVEL